VECCCAGGVGGGLGLYWSSVDAHVGFVAEDGAHVCGDAVGYGRFVGVRYCEIAGEELGAVDVEGAAALAEGLRDGGG